MRQHELRRLLIAGALAEVSQALRRDKTGGSRLTCVLELKRRKAAAVALAVGGCRKARDIGFETRFLNGDLVG